MSQALSPPGPHRSLPLDRGPLLRPQRRGDCVGLGPFSARPCPFFTCRHHLLDSEVAPGLCQGEVEAASEAVVARLEAMADTCSLDVADRGGTTLKKIEGFFDLSRERIRQLVLQIIRHNRRLFRGRLEGRRTRGRLPLRTGPEGARRT